MEELKISRELYNIVREYVVEKHAGQTRRSGEPVINHPLGVAEILAQRGYGLDFQIVAMLHDILEDTDQTEKDLESLGLPKEIIEGVVSLTRYDDIMTLEDSIELASKNKYGKVIKGADRLQNARTTYEDKNTQEFISGFVFKSVKYYMPMLKRVDNPFVLELEEELARLCNCMVPEATTWLNEKLGYDCLVTLTEKLSDSDINSLSVF